MNKNQKNGVLIYHCRRCDKYIKVAEVIHLPSAMKGLCVSGKTTDRWGREEFSCRPHVCPDGQIGVTDIVGGEFVEEMEEEKKKTD